MMEWINILRMRLRALFRRESVLRDIEEELRVHVEMETETNIKRGMPPDEARASALKSFGNLVRNTELGYDIRGGGWLETLWQDLRYGARALLKRPIFTLAIILTLALGIGANTAIFSVFNGIVLKPLPYKDPDRLVYVWKTERRGMGYQAGDHSDFGSISPGAFHDWRERSRSFGQMTAYRANSTILSSGDLTMYVVTIRAAERFFETLGASAQLGRTFTDRDYAPDAPRSVILANDMWRSHYAADPQIIGRTILLDGLPHTVIGVMPPGFWLTAEDVPRVWVPYFFSAEDKTNRASGIWSVIARLRPGISFDQAQTEMDILAAQLGTDYPEAYQNSGVALVPASVEILGSLGGLERVFLLLLCAVGLVLLIACVNVANLLLVRAVEREREFALRAAMGASRWRLVRQLLTESLLLAALGGALGLLLGANGMSALTALLSGIPRLDDLRFDWQAFAFTAAVSLVTGLLFGLAPAIRAARPDLQEALKEGGRGAASSRRVRRMGNLLVIGEVALAMLLLVGAGLIVQSFIRLRLTDPGFATGRMLTIKVNVPDYKYGRTTNASRPGSQEFVSRIKLFSLFEERLNSLPGIESAAVSERLPIGQWPGATGISIDGRAPVADEFWGCAELRQNGLPCHGAVGVSSVSTAYFRTIGMRLIRGRLFDKRDTADTLNVALINEAMARKYWPDEDPIGKSFALNFSSWFPKAEIIGVVSDIKTNGLNMPPYPVIYRPDSQLPSDDCHLIIRTKAAPEALAAAVREELGRIDRNIPLRGVRTMEVVITDTLWRARLSAWLFGLFAALAATLAAAGLYGVMSYSVNQRSQEIGLRMALGATSRDVLRMVIGEGFKLTVAGLALGLAAAFALSRLIAGQLFGVTATDPLTYGGVAMLLGVVALIACYLPARRAVKVDPLQALRHE